MKQKWCISEASLHRYNWATEQLKVKDYMIKINDQQLHVGMYKCIVCVWLTRWWVREEWIWRAVKYDHLPQWWFSWHPVFGHLCCCPATSSNLHAWERDSRTVQLPWHIHDHQWTSHQVKRDQHLQSASCTSDSPTSSTLLNYPKQMPLCLPCCSELV